MSPGRAAPAAAGSSVHLAGSEASATHAGTPRNRRAYRPRSDALPKYNTAISGRLPGAALAPRN